MMQIEEELNFRKQCILGWNIPQLCTYGLMESLRLTSVVYLLSHHYARGAQETRGHVKVSRVLA